LFNESITENAFRASNENAEETSGKRLKTGTENDMKANMMSKPKPIFGLIDSSNIGLGRSLNSTTIAKPTP
jgi:hypothetical protein